jgi:aldose 1-epimerase
MSATIVSLQDAASGATAEVLVSQGFNCYRLAASARGRLVDVIYAPADFAAGIGRPSRGGIPLLVPFPGRIAGTTFRWQGRDYPLEPGDTFGNAIHGFAHARPWRVLEQSPTHVTGQFQAWRDDPGLKSRWPADVRITATYQLAADRLDARFLIENPCDAPLPLGFGTHPYFRVPLGGQRAEDCVVKLPVSARWELQDMLATGQRTALPNAAAFAAGQPFGEMQFDDVLSGLSFAGEWCTTSIHDPGSGITVTQRFDAAFRECVVYTPPHRQAICIEPYTCVPGAASLAERGIDAGLRILPPGGSLSARVEISVS